MNEVGAKMMRAAAGSAARAPAATGLLKTSVIRALSALRPHADYKLLSNSNNRIITLLRE